MVLHLYLDWLAIKKLKKCFVNLSSINCLTAQSLMLIMIYEPDLDFQTSSFASLYLEI